jgi:hypothetical protein
MSFREVAQRPARAEKIDTTDGTFYVKCLSGAERSAIEKEWQPLEGDDFTAIIIARTVCDAAGVCEYAGVATADAIAEVLNAPAPVNLALANLAWKLNKMGKSGKDAEKNA